MALSQAQTIYHAKTALVNKKLDILRKARLSSDLGVSAFDKTDWLRRKRREHRTEGLRDEMWILGLWNTNRELRASAFDYWFLFAAVINISAWRIQWGNVWQMYSFEAADQRGHVDTTNIDICWTWATAQWLMGMLSAMESQVRVLHFHMLQHGSRIGVQITKTR
jgi:hypothetical protein